MAAQMYNGEVLLNEATAAYWRKVQGTPTPRPEVVEPTLRNPIVRLFALLADELPDDIADIDRNSNCLGLPAEMVIPFNEDSVRQMGQVCIGCEDANAIKCATFRQAYGVDDRLDEMVGLSDYERRTVIGLVDGQPVEALHMSVSVVPTLVAARSVA